MLCYDEFALGLAAHLAEHLGLPGIPYSVVAGVRDKHKVWAKWWARSVFVCVRIAPDAEFCSGFARKEIVFECRSCRSDWWRANVRACTPPNVHSSLSPQFRQTCVAHGVAAPKFVHVSHTVDERVERMFEEHGMQFPVVVKPARGAGSSYVKKVCPLSRGVSSESLHPPTLSQKAHFCLMPILGAGAHAADHSLGCSSLALEGQCWGVLLILRAKRSRILHCLKRVHTIAWVSRCTACLSCAKCVRGSPKTLRAAEGCGGWGRARAAACWWRSTLTARRSTWTAWSRGACVCVHGHLSPESVHS